MRSKTLTVTASASGVSSSPVYVADLFAVPFNIGAGISITGSAAYTIQYTFDDPLDINLNTSAKWLNDGYFVSVTKEDYFATSMPVTGIRITIDAATSATATMKLIQTGPIG